MTIVKRICLYVTEHTPRVFAERLDYITGVGHRDEDAWRTALRVPGGGPTVVITPLAILDFEGPGGSMRVRELMAGATLDEVIAGTGFELTVADDLREIEPPSADELETLRRIDPLGTRRLEFREWRDEARARLAAERPPEPPGS